MNKTWDVEGQGAHIVVGMGSPVQTVEKTNKRIRPKKAFLTCEDDGTPTGIAGAFVQVPVPFEACAPRGTRFSTWATRAQALKCFGDLPVVTVELDEIDGRGHPQGNAQRVLHIEMNPYCHYCDNYTRADGLTVTPLHDGKQLVAACYNHKDESLHELENIAASVAPIQLTWLSPAVGRWLTRQRLNLRPLEPVVCRCRQVPLRLGWPTWNNMSIRHLELAYPDDGLTYRCPDTGMLMRPRRDLEAQLRVGVIAEKWNPETGDRRQTVDGR